MSCQGWRGGGYGLQHIVSNMSEDVHKSLGHWEEFSQQLKQLEAFLRVDERRKRFIWTCLRNTSHAKSERLFERFKGSLYESRWHQVVDFIKNISKLLGPLATAWNEGRYVSGVDFEGKQREKQVNTQARQDDAQGLHAFNPKKLTGILSSSLFHMYASMTLLIDEVPDELARKAEGCPCHREVMDGLSEYKGRKLLEKHYGHGITTCPMAGKLLPELVAGELQDYCQQVWDNKESDLFQFLTLRVSPPHPLLPLSPRERALFDGGGPVHVATCSLGRGCEVASPHHTLSFHGAARSISQYVLWGGARRPWGTRSAWRARAHDWVRDRP